MLIVHGSAVAAEGRFNELLTISQEHVLRSRAEPGCISHAVHQDTENPLRLVFVEEWQDLAALHQHFKVPASRQFARALAGMVCVPPTLAIYEATPVKV